MTKSEDPFSALILFRPRSAFGGGPRSPARPPLAFPGKEAWLQARPDRRCGVGALLSRQWLLEVGVVGDTISSLLRFPVLDASATPFQHQHSLSLNNQIPDISLNFSESL